MLVLDSRGQQGNVWLPKMPLKQATFTIVFTTNTIDKAAGTML